MAVYLHRFNNSSEFRKSYFENGDYKEPWIGAVDDGSIASYNQKEETFEEQTEYLKGEELTFHILSDGAITWMGPRGYSKTIEYCLNGQPWVSIESYPATTINVVKGDEIRFRGDNSSYYGTTNAYSDPLYSKFSATCEFSVCGNIMSMINSTGFTEVTEFDSSVSSQFIGFFKDCVGLKNSSGLKLPSNTRPYCYRDMFNGCTGMTGMPTLPKAERAEACCFMAMFSGCTSLVNNIPKRLEATFVDSGGYMHMFEGCESMVDAPDIAATGLGSTTIIYAGNHNMSSMFKGCTSLVNPPHELLPLNINACAYSCMFSGCTSLQSTPIIYGEDFHQDRGTWENMVAMFAGCTSLVSACTLGVYATKNPGGNHFTSLFRGCTSLKYIPTYPYSTIGNCDSMFSGCTSLVDASNFLDNVTALAPANQLAYAGNFQSMFEGCTSLTEPPKFRFTALRGATFKNMFKGCTSLEKVPEGFNMERTYIGSGEFESMFEGCTSMTNIPTFGKLTKSGNFGCDGMYKRAFYGCTGLTASPLTSMTASLGNSAYSETFVGTRITDCPPIIGSSASSYVFYGTFSGVTTLTGATQALSASTVGTGSYYNMFYGCSNLVNGPSAICANTIGDSACTKMFYGCTKLTDMPAMPSLTAVSNASFVRAFESCTNLTGATQLANIGSIGWSAYTYMFRNCYSLQQAQGTLPVRDLPAYCYCGMYAGCSNLLNGPVILATAVTGNYSMQYMFSGCSSMTGATPDIMIEAYSSYTCSAMFKGCSSLVNGPVIRCTTAPNYTFSSMFSGCTSLQSVGCLADAPTTTQFSGWMTSVKSNGTFYASSTAIANNAWARSASGVTSTWTITEYVPLA